MNIGRLYTYMTVRGQGRLQTWFGYLLIASLGLSFFIAGQLGNEMRDVALRNGFEFHSMQSSLLGFLGFVGGGIAGLAFWLLGRKVLPWNAILWAAVGVEVVAGVVVGVSGAQNYTMLAICRILQGAVQVTLAGLGTGAISMLYSRETAHRINSTLQPWIALGVAIGLNIPRISGATHIDWPMVILMITILIGIAEGVALGFVPDLRPFIQQAIQDAQQAATTQQAAARLILVLIVYAGLQGIAQQLLVNSLFTYPEAALEGLGKQAAQAVAGNGGTVAFVGAIFGALVAAFVPPKIHFPVTAGLLAVITAGFGLAYLFAHQYMEITYYVFALSYNLGLGTLCAPMAQSVQNNATRTTATGVFIIGQGLTSSGYALLFLPLLQNIPGLLFFGSAGAIAVVGAVLILMYRNFTEPAEQGPAHSPTTQLSVVKDALSKEQDYEQQRITAEAQRQVVQAEMEATWKELRAAQVHRLTEQLKADREKLAQAKVMLEALREHEKELKLLKTQLEEVQGELQSTHAKIKRLQKGITKLF